MLDGMTVIVALPDFIRNKKYPKQLRLIVGILMFIVVVAAFFVSVA